MSRQVRFLFQPTLAMPPICVRCGQAAGPGVIETKGGGSDLAGKHLVGVTMHFPLCPACEAYAASSKKQRRVVAKSVDIRVQNPNKSKVGETWVTATFQNVTFGDWFAQANAAVFAATEARVREEIEKKRFHKDDWTSIAGLGLLGVIVSLFMTWTRSSIVSAPKVPVMLFAGLAFLGLGVMVSTKRRPLAVLGAFLMLTAGIGIAWRAGLGLSEYDAHTPAGLWLAELGAWAIVLGGLASLIVAAIWGPVWGQVPQTPTPAATDGADQVPARPDVEMEEPSVARGRGVGPIG